MPPWPDDNIYQKNIGYVDNIPDLECRQKNERYGRVTIQFLHFSRFVLFLCSTILDFFHKFYIKIRYFFL